MTPALLSHEDGVPHASWPVRRPRTAWLVRPSDHILSLTHDLRTPLLAEQKALEFLLAGLSNSSQDIQQLLNSMLRNNRELLGLVNRLLEAGQDDMHGVEPKRGDVIRVDQVIASVLDVLAPMAKAKQTQLIHDTAVQLPPLRMQAEHLRRMVVNLVGNAIQHGKPGGRVIVSAACVGGHYEIQVDDNGPGLATRTTWVKRPGTGYGLRICQDLAALYEGTLECRPKRGPGSRFVIRLPYAVVGGEYS